MLTSIRQGRFCAVKEKEESKREKINIDITTSSLEIKRSFLNSRRSSDGRPLHLPALEVVIPVTKMTLFQEQCCHLIAHLHPTMKKIEEDTLCYLLLLKKNDDVINANDGPASTYVHTR